MEKTITSKKPGCAMMGGNTAMASEKKATVSGSAPAAQINAQAVARRAYFLWEREGHQHGRDREYWLKAEELLRKELAKTHN